MSNNYFKPGTYNVACDRCNQKYKRDQCQTEWTGFVTCFNCYDPRHPVTMPLPVVIDNKPLPDVRRKNNNLEVAAVHGQSVWGVSYLGPQGLDPNLNWEGWASNWDENPPTSSFILGE